MKISVTSDLHLEFDEWPVLENTEQADVLVLAGDIIVANILEAESEDSWHLPIKKKFEAFMEDLASKWKTVIVVAGNHEFYHGKFVGSINVLRNFYTDLAPNVFFLESEALMVDNVLFVGGTVWTNMNNMDGTTMYLANAMMNDYRQIVDDSHGYTRLKPATTVSKCVETLQDFSRLIQDNIAEKVVVISHHAPTFKSVAPEYVEDELNGAYASDHSEFILERPSIKLWLHGHMHALNDYEVGGCRVFSNPRGYPGQLIDWTLRTVEI